MYFLLVKNRKEAVSRPVLSSMWKPPTGQQKPHK